MTDETNSAAHTAAVIYRDSLVANFRAAFDQWHTADLEFRRAPENAASAAQAMRALERFWEAWEAL